MSDRRHADEAWLRLVFVTPSDRARRATRDLVAAVAEGGVTAVLLREPQLPLVERGRLYDEAAALCRTQGVRVFVSRDPELAEACGADGVQTGWGGPSVASLRGRGSSLCVGRSCHIPVENDDRLADYLMLSPFRATPRSHPRPVLTERDVAAVLAMAERRPVVALGGLGPADVDALPDGLAGVAVMRALAAARDPRGAAAILRSAVDARWSFGAGAALHS